MKQRLKKGMDVKGGSKEEENRSGAGNGEKGEQHV